MSETQPLVTIITPSYNQGQFIAATIDSVLAQDYPRIEFLVMDGGSTDQTLAVLHSYGARVRWLSQADKGQADAINKGVALTSGSIVTWLNSDDILLPNAVSAAVREFNRHTDAALVYGNGEFIDRDGRVFMPATHVEPFDWYRLLNVSDFILQPAAFFRRAAFLAVGGLDPNLHYVLDYDLWLKLARCYPIHYFPTLLARSRVYPEAKTFRGGMDRLIEVEQMIRRHGRRRLPVMFYAETVRTAWQAGLAAANQGHWDEALNYARYCAYYGAVHVPEKIRRGVRRIDQLLRKRVPC